MSCCQSQHTTGLRNTLRYLPYSVQHHGHGSGTALAGLLWALVVVGLLGTALLVWQSLRYAPLNDADGIRLSNVLLEYDNQQLHLSADAHITLPATVEAGLDSGVPLTFVLSLQLLEPRSWWLDQTVVSVQRRYTLTYYELTRHYRVSALETDVNRNFRSLSSALAGLGELGRSSFELDDQQVASMAKEGLVAALDMSLLRSALPLPLQPIIRSSWTLQSQEYRWPVT